MNMNIAFTVRTGLLRGQDVFFVKILGAFRAVFKHGAHRSIAVDVGIVALEIAVLGIGKGDLVVNTHEVGVHLACATALSAIDNVLFGYHGIAVVHQHDLDHVLNILNAGGSVPKLRCQTFFYNACQAVTFFIGCAAP